MIDLVKCITFHQPRISWNKGVSLPQLPFGVRSCEVVIIWPNICASCNFPSFHLAQKKVFLQPEQLCQHRCDESMRVESFRDREIGGFEACWWLKTATVFSFANKNQRSKACLDIFWCVFCLPRLLYLGCQNSWPGMGFFFSKNPIWTWENATVAISKFLLYHGFRGVCNCKEVKLAKLQAMVRLLGCFKGEDLPCAAWDFFPRRLWPVADLHRRFPVIGTELGGIHRASWILFFRSNVPRRKTSHENTSAWKKWTSWS